MPPDAAEFSTPPQAPARGHAHHPRDQVVATVVDFEAARAQATSQRQFARDRGVARTTLQGWLRARDRHDDDPAAVAFFESPAGLRVLHRVLVAALLVMTLVGACGLRHVQLFLQLAGLSRWIACSFATLRRRAVHLEIELGAFAAAERDRLAATMPPATITTCQDETFHPQTCLVAIEPVSDFILLERYAAARDAPAWTAALATATAGLPVTIAQVTSDEAKGLRAHVRDALGAHPSPDLFHVQHEATRATAAPLAARVRRTAAAVDDAQAALAATRAAEAAWRADHGPGRPPDWQTRAVTAATAVATAVAAHLVATTQQDAVRAAVRGVSAAYHPYDLATGAARDAARVGADLTAHLATARATATAAGLPARSLAGLDKAARVVPGLVATIAWFHRTVTARIAAWDAPAAVCALVREVLIPLLYVRGVARRATGADGRAALRAQADALRAALTAHPVWVGLTAAERAAAVRFAQACADLFQRTSACVEGRNGQLSLHHHHLHRLSPRKLTALTAVHNFVVRRRDGTTAAARFFGAPPRDAFEHLCATLPLPARPRRASRRERPTELAAVA